MMRMMMRMGYNDRTEQTRSKVNESSCAEEEKSPACSSQLQENLLLKVAKTWYIRCEHT